MCSPSLSDLQALLIFVKHNMLTLRIYPDSKFSRCNKLKMHYDMKKQKQIDMSMYMEQISKFIVVSNGTSKNFSNFWSIEN